MSLLSKIWSNVKDEPNYASKPEGVIEITFSFNTVYFLRDESQIADFSEGIYGGTISSLIGTKLGDMLDFEVGDRTIGEILGVASLTSFKVDGRPTTGDYEFTGKESSVHFYASGDDKGNI